jgi:hypothetical protein
MKTTLFAVLGVSLFLGGCGAHPLRPTLGGAPAGPFVTLGFPERDDHATLAWNAARKPLAPPAPLRK